MLCSSLKRVLPTTYIQASPRSVRDELPTLLKPTVWLENDKVVMLDRRLLPNKIEYVNLVTDEDVARAIEKMVIQGAGSIAIAAGYGMALALRKSNPTSNEQLKAVVERAATRLIHTRPTGSMLARLIEEAKQIALNASKPEQAWKLVAQYVDSAEVRSRRVAELCGKNAASLLNDGERILTHCYAGPALIYMLMEARALGKKVDVFATETRPYLQGAKLTAFTLKEAGIDTTLITDSSVGYCMWKRMIGKLFTAADRIAMDGSVANKVGTYLCALAAHQNKVPFYVLGYGGPDKHTSSMQEIPIEERNPEELFEISGQRIALAGIAGYYPAFDVTPPELVTGIVTDKGTFRPTEIKRYFETPQPNPRK